MMHPVSDDWAQNNTVSKRNNPITILNPCNKLLVPHAYI